MNARLCPVVDGAVRRAPRLPERALTRDLTRTPAAWRSLASGGYAQRWLRHGHCRKGPCGLSSTRPSAAPVRRFVGVPDAHSVPCLVRVQWHVGFADPAALPINRGWDKAYNYYGGAMTYYTKLGWDSEEPFLDIHANGVPDRTERHVDPSLYSGRLWQERAEQVIAEHAALGTDQPLFLYYAMQNPHGIGGLPPNGNLVSC
jgi:hypothetical protein